MKMIKKIIKKILSRLKRLLKNFIFYLKNCTIINYINKKIANNNKQNIIPVIIDCGLSTLNQYLEPVVEELVKIPEQKFEFYFGETISGAGSSYFCYNKNNVFPSEIYQKLRGKMIFLSPHIYPKGPPSALKILFDHAMCTMKYSHHPIEYYKNYDIYCVTGELYEEKITKTLKNLGLDKKVLIANVGFPKSDKLHRGDLSSKEEIFSRLKLNPEKKTVIYAPSWEEGLSAREFGVPLVETIIENKELNLIIKFHPCFFISKKDTGYLFYTGGIDWEKEFSHCMENGNCVFIKEFKIDELLLISDIMVTDFSSVALEFLVLGKPVIYLDCPKFEKTCYELYKEYNELTYSDLLKDPYSNAGRHVGLVNYDHKNILNDIFFLIENPDYKIKEREEYSQKLLSNRGYSSKISASMILEQFNKRSNVSITL
jgi:hypothetical protein